MNIKIKPAENGEAEKIYHFYEDICRGLEGAQYSPLWQIGLYPCIEDIKNHIKNKDMYISIIDGRIAGAMATVNHGDYSSLHLFAVHSDFRNQHLGGMMMNKLLKLQRKEATAKLFLMLLKETCLLRNFIKKRDLNISEKKPNSLSVSARLILTFMNIAFNK